MRVVNERRAYKANRVNFLVSMTQTQAWQKKTSGSFSLLKSDVDILNVSDSILMVYEDAADFLLQAPKVRSMLPALGKDLFTFYQEISIHLIWRVTRWPFK